MVFCDCAALSKGTIDLPTTKQITSTPTPEPFYDPCTAIVGSKKNNKHNASN